MALNLAKIASLEQFLSHQGLISYADGQQRDAGLDFKIC